MNRRATFAAVAALVPLRARADSNPFPLAPRPNPNITCAQPFLRRQEQVDRAEQFRNDLIVWSYDNQHVISAYVMLAPELVSLAPASLTLSISRTTFRFVNAPPGGIKPDGLWMIVPDCGALL